MLKPFAPVRTDFDDARASARRCWAAARSNVKGSNSAGGLPKSL